MNPSTKVEKIFDLSWQLDKHRHNMIKKAKNRVQRISQKDAQDLATLLTNLEHKTDSRIPQSVYEQIDNKVLEFVNALIENTQISEDGEVFLSNNKKSVNDNTHVLRIKLSTIENKISEIINTIDDIGEEALKNFVHNSTNEKWKEANLNLKNIVSSLVNFLGEDGLWTEKGFLRRLQTNGLNTAQAIDDLDILYQIIKAINRKSCLPQIYGMAWERKLELFSQLLQKKSIDTANELVDEYFATESKENGKVVAKKRTSGDTPVYRGTIKSNSGFFDESDFVGKQKINKKNGSEDEEKVCKIDAFDEKMGKMDVKFIMPNINGNNKTFRISAKSWKGLAGKDFGSTSLFNALLRTANLDDTLAYGLPVGYYNNHFEKHLYKPGEKGAPDYHAFAKTCIFLDIVMGYSQTGANNKKAGYADTIVIQDRTTRKIHVYSIFSLLEKLEEDIDNFKGISYDEEELSIDRYLGKKWWLSHLQQKMHKIKVSVLSSALNNDNVDKN